MSIAYELERPPGGNGEAEAFLESVHEAARTGRRYRPLALAAMAAARAALSEGRYRDVESESGALEAEWEISPTAFQQAYAGREAAPSAALMEHLGHAAAEAESNGEAFAFLAPLLPLALKALPLAGKAASLGGKLLPKIASRVAKVAPKLIRGVNAAAKSLRTNPATQPLVKALPQVVRRTTADLAQQIAQGQTVTPQSAVRTLAQQTASVLGDPLTASQTLHRAQSVDQKVDQAVNAMALGAALGAANGAANAAGPELPQTATPACNCFNQGM